MRGRPQLMNRFERNIGFKGEAKLKYLDGEVQVVTPGDFVRCAVTGRTIPLDELRYWSVELQEAYVDAAASLNRHRELNGASRALRRRPQRRRAVRRRHRLQLVGGGTRRVRVTRGEGYLYLGGKKMGAR